MIDLGDIKKVTGAELFMILADGTELTLGADRIAMNGIVFDNSTSMDGQFTIGAAVTGELTVTLINDDETLSLYNFRDAEIHLSFIGPTEIPVDEGDEVEMDDADIGTFFVADYSYDGSDIVLTAYDTLCKFDIPCTETNNVEVGFPIKIKNMVAKAAQICTVTLLHQSDPIPNGDYEITQQPEDWKSMTWHDVISYCAQIGGTYAKVDNQGYLYFDWYDLADPSTNTDGGTFLTSTTPYSDGADVDGGTFDTTTTPYSDGDNLDGGTFSNYPAGHVIPSPYSMTIDTDDVCITGLQVVLEASDNIEADDTTDQYTTPLYGSEGYVITISGNPFIQTVLDANAVKQYLGVKVVGMFFRPLTASIVEDPTIESGDCAYITGLNGNTYQCFISHVTYTSFSATEITCDAEPNKSSKKTRFTYGDRMQAQVTRIQKKLDSAYQIAGNTNQYFWMKEEGSDTGAHITQVPREEWDDSTSQNYHSGGNLLARTNGIAIRDGLTEMARFSSDAMVIGTDDDFQMFAEPTAIRMIDPSGNTGFRLSLAGNSTSRNITTTRTVGTTPTWFNAPINSTTITFSVFDGNTTHTATKTNSQLPIGDSFTISGTVVSITREGNTLFRAVMSSGVATLLTSYTTSFDKAKINFTGGNNILWSDVNGPLYMNENQTITLSEYVTEQLSGIVLVWSAYDSGSALNIDWQYQFIPKDHVIRADIGTIGSGLFISTVAGRKFVYVNNKTITGHSQNDNVIELQNVGITLTNTHWVLRYVLGV